MYYEERVSVDDVYVLAAITKEEGCFWQKHNFISDLSCLNVQVS